MLISVCQVSQRISFLSKFILRSSALIIVLFVIAYSRHIIIPAPLKLLQQWTRNSAVAVIADRTAYVVRTTRYSGKLYQNGFGYMFKNGWYARFDWTGIELFERTQTQSTQAWLTPKFTNSVNNRTSNMTSTRLIVSLSQKTLVHSFFGAFCD